jgi:hypothetical protein
MGVDWGDAPTWAGAVSATAALVFAGRAIRQTNQLQTDVVEDRRRRQAALVSCWLDPLRMLRLQNRSDEPVYAVMVFSSERSPHRPGDNHTYLDYLGPGEDHQTPWDEDSPGAEPLPVMYFSDAMGIDWVRDAQGRLSEGRTVA